MRALLSFFRFIGALGRFILAVVLAPFRPQAGELRRAQAEGRAPRSPLARILTPTLLLLVLLFTTGILQAATTALPMPTKILRSGITPTAVTMDSVNGNKVYLLTDAVILTFRNPGATSTTITATDQSTSAEGYSTNATIPVHGGQTVKVGPWRRARWADANGYLQISFVGLTTTTVECERLPYGEEDKYTK